MAQRIGIHLAARKGVQYLVAGDQYYFISLVGLQVDHCGLKQSNLADKKGDISAPLGQGESGSRVQQWYERRTAGANNCFGVGIAQLGNSGMGVLKNPYQRNHLLCGDRKGS